jgi:hypothetical protein
VLQRVQKRGGVPPSSFVDRAVVVAAALALAALLSAPAGPFAPAALAQSPTPTAIVEPADPRTDNEAPELAGSPLLAALAVVLLGALAALGTFVYVRLVERR